MPNLGIAHLAVRQTNIHAAGADQSVGVCGQIAVNVRCLGRLDGIADGLGIDAKTVQDNQGDGAFG